MSNLEYQSARWPASAAGGSFAGVKTKALRHLPERFLRLTVRAGSRLRDVGRLWSFLTLNDFELYPIALGQGLEAVPLDGAEVNEDVGASLAGDEAVTLRVVEPLHGAGKTSH